MEMGVAVALAAVVVFLGCVGYKIFSVWSAHNTATFQALHRKDFDEDYRRLQDDLERAQTAAHNWRGRYKRLSRSRDIEFDEDDQQDEEAWAEQDEEGTLSEIVKALWPKIPPSLAKIIDKPAFADAVAKTAERNPDGVAAIIGKLTAPKEQQKHTSNAPAQRPPIAGLPNDYKETYY